jgi:hypothetical protein
MGLREFCIEFAGRSASSEKNRDGNPGAAGRFAFEEEHARVSIQILDLHCHHTIP